MSNRNRRQFLEDSMFAAAAAAAASYTPGRELFAQDERHLSNGCVRLQDYKRFAGWVFGYVPQSQNGLEQKVDLPRAVPVYMTYLTVAATANGVTFRPDIYGFDALAMPQMFGGTASIASAEDLGLSLGST